MILQQFRLDGKTAIITGASRGLGQAMALALAEAGADIAGVSTTGMEETAGLIEQAGKAFLPLQEDLRSMSVIPRIIDRTIERFGKLNILINNAGIIRRQDSIDFEEKDWDEVMDINLKSLFFLSQAAARRFIAQGGGGKIVNIASMLSFQGGIRVPSYTASKSGLAGLTRLLANEWASRGINVNAIAPGYMATRNTEALRKDEKRNTEILARIPAGRWGNSEDMAGAALFLCSEASAYVNGHILAVDGGWLAR